MTIFVAEINGSAISVMNAKSTVTAEDWFGGAGFHIELTLLRDEAGHPLWDGQAEIHVRTAHGHEEEVWKRERANAATDDAVDDEAQVLVFLIPVIDDRADKDD